MTLRSLLLDMNSYFASVEQQMRPELRGRPIAVVPLVADTTCCIAASYEAKKFGIRTGTPVGEAKRMCRGLMIVEARPPLYVETHHRIVEAVHSCIPVTAVLSIDEMECRLWKNEERLEDALKLAAQIKQAIRSAVGEFLKCSIGLAPNRLLSKVAADWQKPDGLTVIEKHELPQRMFALPLRAFPGIGSRMEQRLLRAGITTTEHLYAQSASQLGKVWGSRMLGDVWYRRLRGEDLPDPPTQRRSIGHSHVLPPELRNDRDARIVLLQLLDKAAMRLRKMDYLAGAVSIHLDYVHHSGWAGQRNVAHCHDTPTLIHAVSELWSERAPGTPLKVGVVLGDLVAGRNLAVPLFDEDRRRQSVSRTMDEVRQRFGPQSVLFAELQGKKEIRQDESPVPARIAFNHIPDLSLERRRAVSSRPEEPAAWDVDEPVPDLPDCQDDGEHCESWP